MRIIYFDLDSLRADHLGCYGYSRNTSPNIDKVASEGWRYTHCFTSDAPCLPSRTALFNGRFGISTGVVNHAGVRAEPYPPGKERMFRPQSTSWPGALRAAGYKTATVSSFADRHGAWHWLEGFCEVYDPGGRGHEIAGDVEMLAQDWIDRNAENENWFLHVNYYDVHVPYRTPEEFGDPFPEPSLPDWLDAQEFEKHLERPGLRSAKDTMHYRMRNFNGRRHPHPLKNINDVQTLIDGYDTGLRYADESIGRILDNLKKHGILDDTIIIISSDHGEAFGELGGWSAHCFSEPGTCRIPMVVRFPGEKKAQVNDGLHYSFDIAEEILRRAGAKKPENWHSHYTPEGREYLVCSMLAQCAQRSVLFREGGQLHWYLRTWHDGWHGLDPHMLFDFQNDFPVRKNIIEQYPELARKGKELLEKWTKQYLSVHGDPLDEVMAEGGPQMVRCVSWEDYTKRLNETGRKDIYKESF